MVAFYIDMVSNINNKEKLEYEMLFFFYWTQAIVTLKKYKYEKYTLNSKLTL
jgi:hypothetical protein